MLYGRADDVRSLERTVCARGGKLGTRVVRGTAATYRAGDCEDLHAHFWTNLRVAMVSYHHRPFYTVLYGHPPSTTIMYSILSSHIVRHHHTLSSTVMGSY